jgi:hypothetical protein
VDVGDGDFEGDYVVATCPVDVGDGVFALESYGAGAYRLTGGLAGGQLVPCVRVEQVGIDAQHDRAAGQERRAVLDGKA